MSSRARKTPCRKQKGTPSTLTDRAFVMETLQGIVNSGLALRTAHLEQHRCEIRLLSGEVFILDGGGIRRVL
jgi:hypothetical protein